MRYIPVNELKTGMVLGQDISDSSGNVLLKINSALSSENIEYIVFLGIGGVYIEDELSQDIKSKDVLKPEIRQNAIELVKKVFLHAGGDISLSVDEEEEKIEDEVTEIVGSVLSEDDVINNMVEVRTYDDYTYHHSVNVAVIAGVLGAKMHLPEKDLTDLVTSGFLHDVGKVFIDPDILNAPRRLTPDEKVKMMDHPVKGAEFLKKNFNFPEIVVRGVYEHHEWYDGHGYPEHKTGDELLLNSRILKAADVYDAMTGRRIYHAPYLPSEVMEYIMGRSGMEFDPKIVSVMVHELCVYPIGCEVELSDGRKAIVSENHKGYVLRPTVKVIDTGENVDLAYDRKNWNLTITKLKL